MKDVLQAFWGDLGRYRLSYPVAVISTYLAEYLIFELYAAKNSPVNVYYVMAKLQTR